MKLSRPGILLIITVVVASGVVGLFFHNGYFNKTPTIFYPPYPEFNSSGDPILVVFHGRIPCTAPNCEKEKISLVLYQHRDTKTPSTYWLGRVLVDGGNNRLVTQGAWSIGRGIEGYADAEVYLLDSNTILDFRNYWRLNENILLPLDHSLKPKVGNSAWGYMMSRDSSLYGPKTFEQLQNI